MLPLFLLFAAAPVRAASPATITFRKVFKSSSPEYIEIKVDEQGHGRYDIRQLDEASHPEKFEVGPGVIVGVGVIVGET